VPVDGRMAHAQCPGDVHHVRLGQAEPADNVLGRGQDPIAGKRRVSAGHGSPQPVKKLGQHRRKSGWVDAVGLPFK
jgi:hypothetical protein